jgi:replicative DNA helicase
MNINIILLKLFLNKDYFTKYSKIINLDYFKNNNKELFKIFLTLFELHKTSEDSLTTNDLALAFYTNYPLTKDDERVIIDATLEQVDNVEVDEERALEYLNKHNIQTVSTQIAIKALEVSQGKADIETVRELLDSLEVVEETEPEELFVTHSLEELVNANVLQEGLRWSLKTLNKTIGSLRKGNFGFVFARPETGKTTFLASEITGMARQAKERGLGPVVWLGNEEPMGDVMLRCYQAAFEVTTQELYTNLPYYEEHYAETIGTHLKLLDKPEYGKADIERVLKEYQPSLIVFDQIDNIRWVDGERFDLKMKAIYTWARNLAKIYGPVIGICQAGGTGEGKKWLTMNDVDSSHTAKQSTADFILGIGKTNTEGEEYQRFFSISKNKLGRDMDCLPDLRHARLPVTILPDIAKYRDAIEWK